MLPKILIAIAALGPKIPEAIKLITQLIEMFWPQIEVATPDAGLELVELSAEENVALDTITQALNAGPNQTLLDLGRIRRLAKWLDGIASSPIGSAIITILTNLPK